MPDIWFENLGIELYNWNEVAFTIFGRSVYWYGILIGIGITIGLSVAVYNAKRTNCDPDWYYDYLPFGIIIGILGARLYYVVFNWTYYKNNPSQILNISGGGLAIYGGIIAGLLTAIVFTKVKKINFLTFADNVVASLAIAQSIGRWGNFVNREAYGGYTDNLFAMRIKVEDAPTLTQQLIDNIITVNNVQYIQVHPTFLYESVWDFMNFCVLMYFVKHKKFEGQVFLLYFIIYGVGRFFIEGLRVDQLTIGSSSMAISQLIALGTAVVCSILMAVKLKNNKQKNEVN